MTLGLYALAALAEIVGCYAVWAWMRQGASALWLIPGVFSLVLFAWLLTLSEAQFAGRAFAAYGAVYIAASLAWLAVVDRQPLLLSDIAGGLLCIAGALVILYARTA